MVTDYDFAPATWLCGRRLHVEKRRSAIPRNNNDKSGGAAPIDRGAEPDSGQMELNAAMVFAPMAVVLAL